MNYNKTQLAGRLTHDVELKYTPSKTAVANISIAINRRVKKGETWEDEPTYVNDITLWGKTAEHVEKYLKKGSPIFIDGRLKIDTWTDSQTGKQRSKLKVLGESVQFIGTKGEGNAPAQERSPQHYSSPNPMADSIDTDDIPF